MDLRGLVEIREVLSHKWDLVILMHLREGPLRYSQLAQRIRRTANDLNDGVLSKNLKRLQVNGLVDQMVHGDTGHAWALTPRAKRVLVELAKISFFQLDPTSTGDADIG